MAFWHFEGSGVSHDVWQKTWMAHLVESPAPGDGWEIDSCIWQETSVPFKWQGGEPSHPVRASGKMAAPHHEHLWDKPWVLETLVLGWGGEGVLQGATAFYLLHSHVSPRSRNRILIVALSHRHRQFGKTWVVPLFCRIIFSKLGWRDMGAAWSILVSEISPLFSYSSLSDPVPLPPFAPAFFPFSLLSCASFCCCCCFVLFCFVFLQLQKCWCESHRYWNGYTMEVYTYWVLTTCHVFS